ncbi:MAG TPA: protein kinase [Candidatus Cybelea sp.]|nr:protein kinase [Candidatus Cybelea sp.]
MPLAVGTRLGPYEILAPLGAGGMGEVYRARDTRLDRDVAIKILPKQMSADSAHRQRFEREAKTISGLNHPNICTLHDVGSQDGTDYLVMECLEGETLAKRLEKGPLALEQVLKYGAQIADALDRAHHSGVVHRDLKPGNIMLTSGGAKLLDFGLAKPAAMMNGATLSAVPLSPVTQQGTIVGTFQYMSPEQVEGKEVDGRSDIFSLGAVLYEMVTGKRAFAGKSHFSVVSTILEKEPAPIRAVKPLTPPVLEHAIRRCLAKDREERWQSARDLARELEWIEDSGASVPRAGQGPVRNRPREYIAWGVAGVLALALAWVALVRQRAEAPRATLVRSSLQPPPGVSFLSYNFAISPDGSRLAFVALDEEGRTALWVRGMAAANAQQLTDTEGAWYPFWSPDSQRIGFFSQGRLRVADLTNSSVQNLCEAPTAFGGTWNQDGVIVFGSSITGPMYRVSANGGTPEVVTSVPAGSSESHHWPYFLPDGKHFLYYVNWSGPAEAQKNGIYVGSLDGGAAKLIASDISGNVMFAAGHLLYVRDRTVMAQPFDASKLELTGRATPLTQPELDKFLDFWHSSFSVSQEGKLVFQSAADSPSRLMWYKADGTELDQFPELGDSGPGFSPDGTKLAVYADDEHNGKHFIRVYDLEKRISSRLTEGGNESTPVWSPDGKMIAYRDANSNIEEVPVDRSGSPRLVVSGVDVIPCDWSRNGDLLYMRLGRGAFPSLEVYSTADGRSTTLSEFGAEAQFSPDGKWVAYVRVAERQIVVQPYPGPGAHIQVSNFVGSAQPRWSRDGKKIYFMQPDRKLMVVTFDPTKGVASSPQVLAQTRIALTTFGWFQYAVANDGRLLMNSLPASGSSPLTLLTNWTAELSKR